jgi:hypothetical protein
MESESEELVKRMRLGVKIWDEKLTYDRYTRNS